MNEEGDCIEETMEEHILHRLKSLEDSVGKLSIEIRIHSSTDIDSGKKTIYLKGRVDDLENELRVLKQKK